MLTPAVAELGNRLIGMRPTSINTPTPRRQELEYTQMLQLSTHHRQHLSRSAHQPSIQARATNTQTVFTELAPCNDCIST